MPSLTFTVFLESYEIIVANVISIRLVTKFRCRIVFSKDSCRNTNIADISIKMYARIKILNCGTYKIQWE